MLMLSNKFLMMKYYSIPVLIHNPIVHAKVEIRLPDDGLEKEWNYAKIYVNPPYGSDRERKTTIKTWLAKCAYTYRHCETEIIALIPVATNTSHWKKYIWRCASAICFLYDTRLKFLIDGKENKGAPMACTMIYWGKDIDKFQEVFSEFGAVVDIRNLKRIPKIS